MFVSRRQFCTLVGAAGLSAVATRALAADKSTKPLKVIAYNVYACQGWPDDRSLAKRAVAQDQMANRLANELALYQPDVVNLSESPTEAIAQKVAGLLGMNHVRFPSGGHWPGTLLSRFEIVESKNVPLASGDRPNKLFTRHWGRATVKLPDGKLPDGKPLVVHSAHLHPSDLELRLREIAAMLKAMKPDLEAGRSMLLIGDLNHGPDTDEYRLWTDAGWVDTFARVGKGTGLTIKADSPSKRIDYVLAAGPIARQVVESRPLFEGAFRMNLADPESFALSDHLPQLAVFETGR